MVERGDYSEKQETQESELADDFAKGGIESAGAVVGAVGTSLILGPEAGYIGAGAGSAIAYAVRRIGAEWYQRALAPRQKERVQVTYAFARHRIEERLYQGQQPRDDGFFDAETREWSDAEQLLDGVLFHASNAHEERKTCYFGYLFASVAFREDISAAHAHLLLGLAERLSYRQLVCLSFFDTQEFRDRLEGDVDYEQDEAALAADLRAEIDGLARLYLLGRLAPDDKGFTTEWGYSYLGQLYDGVGPTELGRDLADVMELDLIPRGEQEEILAEMLRR